VGSISDGKLKPWAVMAYMVGADRSTGADIDPEVKDELAAMFAAGSSAKIEVASQIDFKGKTSVFRAAMTAEPAGDAPGFKKVDANDHPMWRDILGSLENFTLRVEMKDEHLDAANGGVLHDFIRYGRDECCARRYLVFFHGHAHGPMGLFFDRAANKRVAHTLRLNDLAKSLQAVAARDTIIVFRDCYMNTLETAYQLRHVAEFMIASQSEMPIAGVWPWTKVLTDLLGNEDLGEAAHGVAKRLGGFIDQQARNGTLGLAEVPVSLIDLSKADEMAEQLKVLVHALEIARMDPQLCTACAAALELSRRGRNYAASPGDPALLDVRAMCTNLQWLTTGVVAAAAKKLDEAVKKALLKHYAQSDNFRGPGLYYKPVRKEDKDRSFIYDEGCEAEDEEEYEKLALSEETGWNKIGLRPLSVRGVEVT
jgi:hypothetical protein